MKKKVLVGIVIILVGVIVTIKPKEKYLDITDYDNKLALYVENDEGIYESATNMPTSGYVLNESKSACSNNAKPSWNMGENTLKISNLEQSNTSCYLYFDKNASTKILSNVTLKEGTPDFSQIADTDEGVYKAKDDDGDSYYFRGAVTNNYIKFANKFWRIIRINGDGTIRIIYDGETARENGTTFNAETSAFNTTYTDNMYVGFRYTSGQVHGTGTESTILQKLNTWYTTNLASYASKIDTNVGFCGDRTPYTSVSGTTSGGGTGTTPTYYGGIIRLQTNKAPVLTCPSTEDSYTIRGATKGNKSLTYPIGLITADEAAMAGGLWKVANKSYYLYTGQGYWTLSPSYFNGSNANVFGVDSTGYLRDIIAVSTVGVRPVINLKSNTVMTGTGTMSDPYVVVGGN